MATASKKNNFTQEDEQQDYLPGFLREKRFTLKLMIEAKFSRLINHIYTLTHAEVVWLSRIEDFFLKTEYLTERQVEVIDLILKKHELNESVSFNHSGNFERIFS